MPFVHVKGSRLYYVTNRGEPSVGDHCLVFLHGAGGNSSLWLKQIRHFQKYYSVIALDLPGHGQSDGDGGMRRIEEYVPYLKAIGDALSMDRFFLIGHSMGGAITMEFAFHYSEYLLGVVLTGVGPEMRRAKIVVEHMQKDFNQGIEIGCRRFLFTENTTEGFVEFVLYQLRNSKREVLLNDLIACSDFDLAERGKELSLPTLIIGGEKDRFITQEDSQSLRERIPDSELRIIPDTGHMMMLENHKLFNHELGGFLFRTLQRLDHPKNEELN